MLIASPIAVLLYLANWVVFTLYSIPPVQLKTRGIWGVLADTCGGQLLPTLWTTFGVAALGFGSLAPGLRCWFLLFRYYFTLFPLAFVPQLAQQSAWAWLLIPVHVPHGNQTVPS